MRSNHTNRVQKRQERRRHRKIRILLIDDHPSVSAGVRSNLKSKQHFVVAGQAMDREEAVAKAKVLEPDVAVLDLSLPQMGDLEVRGDLREIIPTPKPIRYSMHDGKGFIHEAFVAGANGFVSKASICGDLGHRRAAARSL